MYREGMLPKYVCIYYAPKFNFSGITEVRAKSVKHAAIIGRRIGRSYLTAGNKKHLTKVVVQG